MDDTTDEKQVAEWDAVDLQAVFSGPAVFANRTLVTRQPLGIRLTFMEMNQEAATEHYRAAVFLQLTDALALADLLTKITEEIKSVAEFKILSGKKGEPEKDGQS